MDDYHQHDHHKRFRLVSKTGECLVVFKISTKERLLAYLRDSFTSFIDMKWRYHFLGFFGTCFATWTIFGLIWYATVDANDTATNSTVSSCIGEVFSMGEAILFSYESQSTVGYGSRYLLPECNFGGYILQILQIFVGVLTPCIISGILFTKSRRPKRRSETIVFSEMATIITKKKKRRLFQFRIGNIRQSNIISTSVRVFVVKERKTNEGEVIPFCLHQLPISTRYEGRKEDEEDNPNLIFLPWPVMVTHIIDMDSPLKDIQDTTLKFEIIVLFEGIVESTGKPSQFRTSYTPDEIIWHHKFAPIVMEFKKAEGEIIKDIIDIDYFTFNITSPVNRAASREHVITKTERAKI
ncbi:hypothetical protein HELRODRAFT_82544 [Helobdella robusta]|uniref:Inward rectifier potassium channel C-terminal domain-containing protein n=1 Tax=Helobdella robusta TaxID=6412 RepID=T1G4T5_HELRO|nr:hypothetical protein HELRODRAFT_82544 [Helobdella robusta]ESO00889.1 hypothetical protein HELRODRAFT_82544 [Helobdella robusta]